MGVLILSGSSNDKPFLEPAIKLFCDWGIPHEYVVASAHRQPEKLKPLVTNAKDKGFKVIIAAAGFAAHLAGICAAYTTLPIIALPICPESNTLGGLDSLLSMVQMPSGVPVATVGINQGKNAAILAAQILGTSNADISNRLIALKNQMANAQ